MLNLHTATDAELWEAFSNDTATDAARDTWADAPLHKQIAAAMGMSEDEAQQFYDLIEGDY